MSESNERGASIAPVNGRDPEEWLTISAAARRRNLSDRHARRMVVRLSGSDRCMSGTGQRLVLTMVRGNNYRNQIAQTAAYKFSISPNGAGQDSTTRYAKGYL